MDWGFLRSRVAQRIFLLFVCSAVVPITVLSIVSFHFVSSELDSHARREQRQAAKSLAMGLYERLEAREAELQLLDPLLDAPQIPADFSPEWRERLERHFSALGLLDEGGSVFPIRGEIPTLPALNAPPPDSPKTVLLTTFEGGAEPHILFVLPPRGGEERGRRLVAELDFDDLFRPAGGNGAPGVEQLAILDDSENVLFSSLPIPNPFLEALAAPENQERQAFSWTDDGQLHLAQRWNLFLNGHFESPAWRFAISSPSRFVLTESTNFKLTLILVAFLCLAVVVLASVISIRRSLVPLDRLKEGTERIAAGDFGVPVQVDSSDEFATLAAAFNEMAASLREQFDALNRNTQELRVARDAAQAASRAKSDFLAMMSHELRTPMNGIIGMAELALESESIEEKNSCMQIVNDSAESLLAVLADILDFAKIEAGKLELNVRNFKLPELLEQVISLLSAQAAEKRISLRPDLDPGVPAIVAGDPLRLQQTLLNLVGNAIKFTDAGQVTVKVGVEDVREDEVRLHFAVSDTGIGIAPDKLDAIFDPFVQAENYLTRQWGGTGLGLATCRKLVKLMQGRLWVESTPGAGSTFHFTALFRRPAATRGDSDFPAVEPRGIAPEAADPGQAPRILIAEDNPVNQMVVSRMLEREGYLIEVVDNGEQAVEAAMSREFDLILMDIQMPVMDGLQATALLREKGLRTPIIALTAHVLDRDRQQCLACGMDDFVTKPIQRTELLELVRTLVSRTGEPEGGAHGVREAVATSGRDRRGPAR